MHEACLRRLEKKPVTAKGAEILFSFVTTWNRFGRETVHEWAITVRSPKRIHE
jgi:hypothetical protein